MARKTKEEAEKTRQKLLDAALAVFSLKGFVRSTLNDIAKEAGVTRGAIYWHFKDKANLFEALSDDIDRCNETRMEDLLERPILSLDDLRERIMRWLLALENDKRFRTFHEFVTYKIEYHEELEPVLAKQRQEKRLLLKRLEEDIRTLQSKGKVREDVDPRHGAIMICSFVWGLVESWLFDQTIFSISETAPTLVNNFLRSLAP